MKLSNKDQKNTKTVQENLNEEEAKEKVSTYISLKNKLTQLSMTLFNTKLSLSKIEKLEKDALRGQGKEVPEPKETIKPEKKIDLLTLILRSEHKSTQKGTQIIKLPKLPFGKHKSYNEEGIFKEKHFLEEDTQPTNERIKDMEEITRKFRLFEKEYKGSNSYRLKTASPMHSNFASVDVYDMGPGQLICTKDNGIIKSYEKDQLKHKNNHVPYLSETYRDFAEELNSKRKRRTFKNYRQQQELLNRLLPSNEAKDTNLSMFYSTKYSSLFDDEGRKGDTQRSYRRTSMT